MKAISSALVLAVGILIGGILGWSLKPVPGNGGGKGGATALARERPSRTVSASASRFDSEFNAMKDRSFKINREDPAQDSAYLEALAAALLKRVGGYDGLQRMDNQGEYHAFSDLLNAMAEKNLGRTLDWIDQVSDPQSRAKLYGNAIQAGMEKSPVRDQLDFFKSKNFTANEVGEFAGYLMFGFENMSTETALYLLGHVQPGDDSSTSGYARFNDTFDFVAFANATLQSAKVNENKTPSYYPTNFFSEWTRSDPQAAASFYFTHCIGKDGLKFPSCTLGEFMKDLHDNIPETDYGNFVGTAFSQQLLSEKPDTAFIDELLCTGFTMPDGLAEKLDRIPDTAARDKLLRETVSRAVGASLSQNGSLTQLRSALSLYKDPVARLAAVEGCARKLSESNGGSDVAGKIHNLCNQLAILGHSKADLQRVRDAAGK